LGLQPLLLEVAVRALSVINSLEGGRAFRRHSRASVEILRPGFHQIAPVLQGAVPAFAQVGDELLFG
jgi:hypothetical protein